MNTLTIYAVLIATLIGFVGGYGLRDLKADSDMLKAKNRVIEDVKVELVAQGKLSVEEAAIANTLEETITAIRPTTVTITKRETLYEKEPVYVNCTVPLSGVRYYNERVAKRKSPEANAAGKRIGEVSVAPAITQ